MRRSLRMRMAALCHSSALPGRHWAWPRGIVYEAHSHTLARGDKVLIFTDGVTEAVSAKAIFFGAKRLHDVFSPIPALASPTKSSGGGCGGGSFFQRDRGSGRCDAVVFGVARVITLETRAPSTTLLPSP